jgi:predicted metalloprotease
MRVDDLPKSSRVEDRRGRGGGYRVPGGRGGGIGIGTIILIGLILWALGFDPTMLFRGADSSRRTQPSPPASDPRGPSTAGVPADHAGQLVSAVLGSTEVQWKKMFDQLGKVYEPPSLVMFSGATSSACGFAQSAMGPFYCPLDGKVYLDTSFFEELERRFRACDVGSKTCQFSQAYVIAHEIGHHVQNLLGILPRVQQMQRGMDQVEANHLQVRVELQADCFAGMWAHHSQKDWAFIEPGDVEAAMQTASAIGDDRLQRRSTGYVMPDAFTHGSSAQRTRWFMGGLKSGTLESCDTFGAAQL